MSPQPTRPRTSFLSGIRVVDFSRYVPGPFCSLQLAWLGAAVTAVEQPPLGDPMRAMPPLDAQGESRAYQTLRRLATVVALDLSTPDDLQRAHALCRTADVVIESFRPGVAARFGIDSASLRAVNPSLIHCAISGYGQTGAWRDTPGHDLNYAAMSGLLDRSGTAETVGLTPLPIADMAGGALAATAICAALFDRGQSGEGASIDLSLTEAALAWQSVQFADATVSAERRGTGTLTGGAACYGVYVCQDDRLIAVAPIEARFFERLCERLGTAHLVAVQWEPSAQDLIRATLAERFRQQSASHWEARLGGVNGCCVTRVLTAAEAAAHPLFMERGAIDRAGALAMPASPFWVAD